MREVRRRLLASHDEQGQTQARDSWAFRLRVVKCIFTPKEIDMNNHVPAPESLDDFVALLLEGKTVYLKTGTDEVPRKLIERIKDKVAESQGVFETDTTLVTQAILSVDFAPKWNSRFSVITENIGLLFYIY